MHINNLIRNLQSWFLLRFFFFFFLPLYIPRSQAGFELSPGIFAQRGPISSLTKPTTFSGPLKNPQISPPKIPIKIISRNRESTRWHHEDPVTSRDLEPRVSDTRQSWGTRGISPCPKVREKKKDLGGGTRRDHVIRTSQTGWRRRATCQKDAGGRSYVLAEVFICLLLHQVA